MLSSTMQKTRRDSAILRISRYFESLCETLSVEKKEISPKKPADHFSISDRYLADFKSEAGAIQITASMFPA